MVTIMVNGVRHEVQAPGDTPLLYVLRNDDATGKVVRRLPLKPAYVQAILKA